MVTLLQPNSTQSNIEYLEAPAAQDGRPKSGSVESYRSFQPEVAESRSADQRDSGNGSPQAQHKAGFIAGIAHPLVALYDLVSGPAMTQRDRHRRALGEAALRDNAGLSWFNRTTW